MQTRDPLILLRLTAELHAAGSDAERWAVAWNGLRRWFDCPEIFDGVELPQGNEDLWRERLSRCCDSARNCAEGGLGHCGSGPGADEQKRRACHSTVDHLSLALAGAGMAAAGSLAALEALPAGLLLCDGGRGLRFANPVARREMERERGLLVRDGRVRAADPVQDGRLGAALSRMAAAGGASEDWIPGVPGKGESVDLALRRLKAPGGEGLILLSMSVPAGEPSGEHLQRVAERRCLPPRQRQLAGYLLAGLSLDQAAESMGISRRTARDHLKGLFRATSTSRQQELLLRLSRDAHG